MNATAHRYSLQKYSGPRTRYTCPACGKAKEFARYQDNETGQQLAPHVGKCNRLDRCGYHYPPSEFFRDNPGLHNQQDGWKASEAWKTKYQAPADPQPVEFLPQQALEASRRLFGQNNFFLFLAKLFGQQKAQQLADTYRLGTSKQWKREAGGLAVIFWQIDQAGNIRQAKAMAYDRETGRRLKAEGKHFVSFLGKRILKNPEANLQQCFFGEHLLAQYPQKPVCLVESEKTAVIMAGIQHSAVWLATGGKNGCRWTEESVYQALAGRQVILYPDLGAFADWTEKARLLNIVCEASVSDLLERKAGPQAKAKGYDLADFFTDPQQAPQQHEPAPAGIPDCFTFYQKGTEGQQGLEYNGLPFPWLNDTERAEAAELMRGFDLEIMQRMNPDLGQLIERFGLIPE